MPAYDIAVPATTANVRSFLNQERERFEQTYEAVHSVVTEAIKGIRTYKIYGRSDEKGRPCLKHPRKVRLKFNSYFQAHKKPTGSLWSVPDIVGFTIVMAFPSDISMVCKVIDNLIDERKLTNANNSSSLSATRSKSDEASSAKAQELIETRFGRPIISNGYFACHYNVRPRGAGVQRPVCEIQVKTVLHDAWGAKSHDLTYKPSGRTSIDLINGFNLLGDTLAKIDQQSDLVRRSIERAANVREQKKSRVQEVLIEAAARSFAEKASDVAVLVDEICALNPKNSSTETLSSLSDRLLEHFDARKQAVCVAFCLLSTRTQDSSILQQAQETIETWYEDAPNQIEKVLSRSIAGLASYSGNDIADAIDMAEHAIELIESLDRTNLSESDNKRLDRLANSTFTSLAYYHADRVGSHEGSLGDSDRLAIEYLDRSIPFRERIGLLTSGIYSNDDEIEAALADPVLGWTAFSTLDNECFVRIQTAKTEKELRIVKRRLDFIHKERPSNYKPTALLLFDYHEFCARSMLAELEAL